MLTVLRRDCTKMLSISFFVFRYCSRSSAWTTQPCSCFVSFVINIILHIIVAPFYTHTHTHTHTNSLNNGVVDFELLVLVRPLGHLHTALLQLGLQLPVTRKREKTKTKISICVFVVDV